VRDDGCGFDVASGGRGYGLEGMRTRLEQVGGSARVRSAPGAGTVIDAWIGEAPA
jgi:signal transduction histidine kinase